MLEIDKKEELKLIVLLIVSQIKVQAFLKLYSKEFASVLQTCENPYGDGCASQKIIDSIKKVDLNDILKKSFFDVRFSL